MAQPCKAPANLEVHLFVCTNTKEGKPCCATKKGLRLRDEVKRICQNAPWATSRRIRINASGCLGRCEAGIAAVLYPEQRWFENLNETDAPLLVEAIRAALESPPPHSQGELES